MINIKIIKKIDKEYPQRLLKTKKSPEKLYVEGDYSLLNKNSIAIVGSRNCTEYGRKHAFKFAEELSKNNICIVSGLAVGIDAAAHLGAMSEIGRTIAVIGCGFNNIYPEENIELYNQILENGGCIVSEYEPGRKADLNTFPKRNRIISGISMGTLVVEAEYRSGSSITAKYTIEEQKMLFCIPSNIDSKQGVGTNRLIKQGALLVTSAEDILDMYVLYEDIPEKNEIPKEYEEIYNYIKKTPTDLNEISRKTGLSISKTSSLLSLMEIEGYIKSLAGNKFVKIQGE